MPDPHGHFFAVARPARKCGAQVMIDIELTTLSELPDPVALLPEADIVSFNRDSFIAVTGDLPAIAAARALLVHGPHTIIVTRGAGGALAVTRDEAAECPGYPVTVVDSTGASDTFNAAFASAMLAGQPLAERLRFEPMRVAIELRGTHTYGMTVCDARHLHVTDLTPTRPNGYRGEAPNAEVAVGANPDRFWEMFLDALASYP
jgi:sugar/nucleoside kinase (ribokinase family)